MILESVTPSLRGELTRWLLEPQAGIFVGNISAMVRDKLWETVCAKLKPASGAMLIHTVSSEQGYTIRTHGTTTRTVADFDGLLLINKRPPKPETAEPVDT